MKLGSLIWTNEGDGMEGPGPMWLIIGVVILVGTGVGLLSGQVVGGAIGCVIGLVFGIWLCTYLTKRNTENFSND
jgi:hypothetical protein